MHLAKSIIKLKFKRKFNWI